MFIPRVDSCRGVTFNIRWRMLGIGNQGRDCPHSRRYRRNREKLGQQLLEQHKQAEEWRSRAYSIRYFIGFTAAGASVGLVAWLYEQGGFVTMLHAFAGLCLLVIAAAIILPREIRTPAVMVNEGANA